MAKIIDRAITTEQFKAVCKAALPHLLALDKIVRDNMVEGPTMIYISPNGYIDMRGGFDGWSMSRLDEKDAFSGNYDYHERFEVTRDGAFETKEKGV